MRKSISFVIVSLLAFASCIDHDFSEVQENNVKANAEKVFGVSFNPNQDWCMTKAGEVTINVNPSIKKVQVLAHASAVDESGVEYTTLKLLNQKDVKGQSCVKLYYDAPIDNLGLYVAFISDDNYSLKKIEGSTVSSVNAARTRYTEIVTRDYTLPEGTFCIAKAEDSYANTRGWNDGELLYQLSDDDYEAMKIELPQEHMYSEEFTSTVKALVFSYFPNGKKVDNLPNVKKSKFYNENVYPITTGKEPIFVSPVFKYDGSPKFGKEVWNSDLYYYYFKAGTNPTKEDIEKMPKYKAFPFKMCFNGDEDNFVRKDVTYALLYYGDGTPKVGDVGSFQFPEGYKIGFMIRAMTDFEGEAKQGEVYGDGRLNGHINNWGNFASSHFEENDPRAAWLTLDNKMLLCWESGTDRDFNDVILEVEGGIENIIIIPDPEEEVYTYCFEDTQLGDYDLNDVVIKATRKDENTIIYSVIACGAYDEVFIKNINCGAINDNTEVHSMFGKSPKQFINTVKGEKTCNPITVEKTVSESFSFLDPNTLPELYDKTKGTTVKMAMQGENPHAIMIPGDFRYPLETICINKAYSEFNNWGVDFIISTDWYRHPNTDKVY